MVLPLTALILTGNEEANIARTLYGLRWVPNILVIDSGSTDATLTILAGHVGVEVIHRPFDSFADQCNFGLRHIGTEWVLSLDADYLVTPELAEEISLALTDPGSAGMAGFSIPFHYCIAGRPVRGTLLPPRICLYRPACGAYRNDGHGHRVTIKGPVGRLRNPIRHDDRKPLQRWLSSQQRYMAIEADKLQATPSDRLSVADRLRKHTPLAPLAALVFCLVWKGGLLDGWHGWAYALQRMYAELLLSLLLMERRLARSAPTFGPSRP
jgi:glycosyltransferase involved in cell wall biosynthesis